MARFGISIAATNAKAYRELAKKMRQAGRTDLRKKLRQNISDAGKPVLSELQENVRTLQVKSSRGGGGMQRAQFRASKARTEKTRDRHLGRPRGLRSEIAGATKLQVTAKGVRFFVDSKRLPENQRTLPRHLDSKTGWDHPTFSNDWKTKVHQKGGPWFAEPLKKKAPTFRAAIVKAMDETAAELDK